MYDPQSTSPGSIMPGYKWMFDNKEMNIADTENKMRVLQKLGVPYTDEDIANAKAVMKQQAQQIEDNLKNDPDFVKSYEASKKAAQANGEKFVPMSDREITALIAYLQRLGTDIKVKENK